jgi:hypothetical protein
VRKAGGGAKPPANHPRRKWSPCGQPPRCTTAWLPDASRTKGGRDQGPTIYRNPNVTLAAYGPLAILATRAAGRPRSRKSKASPKRTRHKRSRKSWNCSIAKMRVSPWPRRTAFWTGHSESRRKVWRRKSKRSTWGRLWLEALKLSNAPPPAKTIEGEAVQATHIVTGMATPLVEAGNDTTHEPW